MFIFSVFDRKYLFLWNLFWKIEIVCLRWNVRARLIQIYWIRWWCSNFHSWTGNTLSVSKRQNCLIKMKLGVQTNSNMPHLMVIFICHALDSKYSFWTNLVRKIRFVCLRWNLLTGLISMRWIRWWCSNFLFWTGNILFGKILFKKSTLFNMKFGTYTNSNLRDLMTTFFCFGPDL